MTNNFYVNNIKLDNKQIEVLLCEDNTLVIAGAGSGKTLTILGKINYLIDNNFCFPKNLLVISFTNASVNDIKNRINSNIDVYTFHKLAIHILKLNNLRYTISNDNLLEYIITEYLLTCSIKIQKIILKYLKINCSYKEFLKSKKFPSFVNFIMTFINLYKANNLNKNDVINNKLKILEKRILIIILNIYSIYIEEKKSTQKYDFDDIIINATKLVKYTNLDYKYIIIDEFQDTSQIRLNLIKEIIIKTKAKIIVVGDDWQSIYQFSGCDLNIFLNFVNIFPKVQVISLKNTYRNSMELINIASTFIQKNPLQLKKDLCSLKHSQNPIVLTPYINSKQILKKILNIITKKTKDIMILSRNNKDIYNFIDNDFILNDNNLFYKNISIKYYTIHKSKGLEADYVIVLNCNNNHLGFPNKIENNKLINKILPNKEIPYAEERRLFYVAITRCKEKVYLVYDKYNPSIFIKQIKKIIKKHLKYIEYFK